MQRVSFSLHTTEYGQSMSIQYYSVLGWQVRTGCLSLPAADATVNMERDDTTSPNRKRLVILLLLTRAPSTFFNSHLCEVGHDEPHRH
jgi:hypothetical protein